MVNEPDVSLALHPGDWFRSAIAEPYRVDLAELAALLIISREDLSTLLHGMRPLTHWEAVRLEHAFGISSELLLRMQESFDLVHADTPSP